uniref:Uncharacterized protein n=1 Tax=Candidatus Kentrum sp. TUN TaxID=2126343 RepID=A0A451A7X2_9GAMM|nr:MAG: hypothetical protein BECKTUN1418D_GA0071000_11689 [Candidatus Kentron sp. TUN]
MSEYDQKRLALLHINKIIQLMQETLGEIQRLAIALELETGKNKK